MYWRKFTLKKKNKGFRNKDPRFFAKSIVIKRQLHRFFLNETKRKLSRRLS